jgi:hypothetical protein
MAVDFDNPEIADADNDPLADVHDRERVLRDEVGR